MFAWEQMCVYVAMGICQQICELHAETIAANNGRNKESSGRRSR